MKEDREESMGDGRWVMGGAQGITIRKKLCSSIKTLTKTKLSRKWSSKSNVRSSKFKQKYTSESEK